MNKETNIEQPDPIDKFVDQGRGTYEQARKALGEIATPHEAVPISRKPAAKPRTARERLAADVPPKHIRDQVKPAGHDLYEPPTAA